MAGINLQTPHCNQPFPDGSCRLLLIGKTGSGKSATGNTIAGKPVFKSRAGMNSETKDGQFHLVERNNLRIEIMDTPGLADTDDEDKILAEKIKQAMLVMHPGPHAMLLVLRCDRRFTEEEYNVYLALKDIFGTNLSSFLIIVFTGLDELERDGHRFEDQIQDKSKCLSLHSILDDIRGRYILFNNRASEEEKEKQVDKLIEKVRELVQENGCIFFQHSFSSDLKEPVLRMMEEEMRLMKEKIKSTDLSSLVSHRMSSQPTDPSGNRRTETQKHIRTPGNSAEEMRKKVGDDGIKTLLPPDRNRPVSEIPGLYSGNQDSMDTNKGNNDNSDRESKVKDLVNRFEDKLSDQEISRPVKPVSRIGSFAASRPTGTFAEPPLQMLRPPVPPKPKVFPHTDQRSMDRPELCYQEDASESSDEEFNFFDDDLSPEELQALLTVTRAWLKELELLPFDDDINVVARYCAVVNLKQKLAEHPEQLSALQHQLYDTTATNLESRIKEGMENRGVKRKNQCRMM